MVGALVALAICYWFYRSAESLKLPHLPWIIGGALAFYATNYAFIYGLLRPLAGERLRNHGYFGGFIIELSGALVGLAAAYLLRQYVMLKQPPAQ
ncbi:MAG: hypothetical protein FIA97_18105 [Methylococcaceae bacterium]|nr:hypothetical protein [Methylococcaceae bacterium]